MITRCGWCLVVLIAGLAPASRSWGWGHEGHQIVNRLALASLPKDFPDFVRTSANAERIVYLGNLADSWRNTTPYLQQSGGSWTDHFLNLELLDYAGLDPRTVSSFRLDYVLAFAAGRAAHPGKFPPIDPATNKDRVREWSGFAPWAMAEYFHKLRSAFSTMKALKELGGTAEEIANAQADAVNAMGIMGHYIGDCAQPLHTTVHHDGWVGPNPEGFTTTKGIHEWMDNVLILREGIRYASLASRVKAAEPLPLSPQADGRDPYFVAAMNYVLEQFGKVPAVYRMEKAGLLGNRGTAVSAEGRAFVEAQLLVGAEMLARTWVSAWKSAPVDIYRPSVMAKRNAALGAPEAPATKKTP